MCVFFIDSLYKIVLGNSSIRAFHGGSTALPYTVVTK